MNPTDSGNPAIPIQNPSNAPWLTRSFAFSGANVALVGLGLGILGLGVLHYALFRRIENVLVFQLLGMKGLVLPSGMVLGPHSAGLGYLIWASFPSFAAACGAPLLVAPLFKPGESARLCAGAFLMLACFEVLQWAQRITVSGRFSCDRFDPLDLASAGAGCLMAYTIMWLIHRGR
ncbi:hypothetical protein [Fundidesulfovibrio soli]|uniref:hypothetical protein n=1 Tax=Fundidesulfovibrio soli TaxID=2922716 RepID=UPI001FAF4DF4|nr:hypothetical protein [Fundidesulfovibrio soli]